jgi:hypothetical protein
VTLLAVPCATVAAQERPWKLPATAEFPNRYEGVIAPEVANPDFEVLSFTGPAESKLTPGSLQVDFYLPADGTASIQARELRNDKYYRMASKPGAWTPKAWNTFGPWPTSDVIVPARVSLDNIGVVVFLNGSQGQSGELAPAFVLGQKRNAGTHYLFVFRTPRTTLTGVQYSLRGEGAAADLWSKTAAGDFIRGTPVFLEFDAASLAPGYYTLRVTCEPVSAAAPRITRDFTFHHARRGR